MSPEFDPERKPMLQWNDDEFDSFFPLNIQKLSFRHWTPVGVIKDAAGFLAEKPGTRVLDIGSGVGKFCLVGAACSKGHFTGVEQRESLIRLSKKTAKRFQIDRVNFIHANINTINFNNFDAFYFYNSFEENIDLSQKIDEDSRYSLALFDAYTKYIFEQFDAAPMDTKIVTYCTSSQEIPGTYVLVKKSAKGKLKFWQKKH